MAKNSEIIIRHELRPCIAGGKTKALFHCWEHYAEPISPGITVGSHPGGQFSKMYGLVEVEDGQVIRMDPSKIRFIDDKHAEICWNEEEAQE